MITHHQVTLRKHHQHWLGLVLFLKSSPSICVCCMWNDVIRQLGGVTAVKSCFEQELWGKVKAPFKNSSNPDHVLQNNLLYNPWTPGIKFCQHMHVNCTCVGAHLFVFFTKRLTCPGIVEIYAPQLVKNQQSTTSLDNFVPCFWLECLSFVAKCVPLVLYCAYIALGNFANNLAILL